MNIICPLHQVPPPTPVRGAGAHSICTGAGKMVRRNASLAQQITLELLADIKDGQIGRDGGALASENELSQRFQVSRATVRDALSKLELAGVVVRRQGVGTFVNPRASHQAAAIQGWADEANSFIEMIRSAGHQAQAVVLEIQVRPADRTAELLEIPPTSPVLAIEKVFLASATPAIHCINVVPLSLVEAGFAEQAAALFEGAESPYQFLARYCHRHVHHQQSEIRATAADERLARLLQCDIGSPLLQVEETGYTAELQPVFYAMNHFSGDIVTFRQVRQPVLSIDRLSPNSTAATPE